MSRPITDAGPGAALEVRALVKTFRGRGSDSNVAAVNGVDVTVAEGEMFTLLGPSGCGKTTTLRSVAGLERPDAGEIAVGGRTFFSADRGINVPANRRGLGMVFQSYAIWPHLDVFSNAAFPLTVMGRRARPSKAEVRRRVTDVLDVVQMGHLASRPSTDLSGGQQQRLALARALVLRPPLLLLDEPLSNLDAKLREDMRIELRRLQAQLGITTLYVTHDQSEALAISSRLAVMNAGRIEQIGQPEEVYARPATRFVAQFIGTMNFLKGSVTSATGGSTRVATSAGELVLKGDLANRHDIVDVAIRPENIAITLSSADRAPHSNGGVATWPGRVTSRVFQGDSLEYVVAVGNEILRVHSPIHERIAEGAEVRLAVDSSRALAYPHADASPAADASADPSASQKAARTEDMTA